MSTRYPGGFVKGSPPTITPPQYGFGGEAPGVWTLEQASYYTKKGTWPVPTSNRYLFSWGYNQAGQLGQNNTTNISSPTQVGSQTNWVSASCGRSHVVALKSDYSIWSWGYNIYGQLGQNNVVYKSSPVQIGALTTWASIACGGFHTVAIKKDGTMWSWGLNDFGQLGQNNAVRRSSPVQVGSLNTWLNVSAGYNHTIAVKTDGSIWAVGGSQYQGQLGLNAGGSYAYPKSSPIQIGVNTNWAATYCGFAQSSAITTNGQLWTWGYNQYGGLGLNFATTYVAIPFQVGTLTNWSRLSFGGLGASAIKTDGTLWSWGYNNNGQAGLIDTITRSSPVQVGLDKTWLLSSMSYTSSVGLKTDGTAWAWGNNGYGQLGQGNTIYRSSPTQIGSTTNWYFVTAAQSAYAFCVGVSK